MCAIYESKTWHWRWFLFLTSLRTQPGVTIQQPAYWAGSPGSNLAGTVTVTRASALGPQTQTRIQSQVCKIMSSFSFTEQPPKNLQTPSYFQKFIFSLKTLEIEKCIQRRQNDTVLKASPFFHRKFSNAWALCYWPSTCNVTFRYSVLPLLNRLHEQHSLRDTTQRSNVGHAQGD